MKKPTTTLILGFAFGIALMLMINLFNESTADPKSTDSMSEAPKEKIPLYWVAPMDANYRKDKPGQSPMGMDLIPYYGDEGGGNDEGPGTIRISANVVNNLGVKTAKAIVMPLHSEINTVGYVQYDEDQIVHIHPRVDGWIETLSVKAMGDRVEKGQVLYEIYSPALVNAQQELVLALTRKNTGLISAAKDRLKSLQIPDSAIKNLIKTKKIKQSIAFYAPQSGFVDMLNIRQGYYVQPGITMMSIAKLDTVWVEVVVFERQAALVSLETEVSMSVGFLPGKTWFGTVDYIYPQLDAKTRSLRLRLRFDNPNFQLKPNMFAQVTMHIRDDEDLLLVPKSAVIRSGKSNRVVLALGEGQYKSINVDIGRIDDDHIEILSGLTQGEEIVVSAQFLLDSESSKTSDFMRMNHQYNANQNEMEIDKSSDNVLFATTKGVITSLMKEHGMISIDRDAIEEWNRPAANVDFIADKSLDISDLSVDDKVFFTFEINNGDFIITKIDKLSTF
jgi:Cu(I)/Ag(I) efflux system membrane fusion protein